MKNKIALNKWGISYLWDSPNMDFEHASMSSLLSSGPSNLFCESLGTPEMFYLKFVDGKCQTLKFYFTELNIKWSITVSCVLFMVTDTDYRFHLCSTGDLSHTLWRFAQHIFISVRRCFPGAELWTTVPFSGSTEERALWRHNATPLTLHLDHITCLRHWAVNAAQLFTVKNTHKQLDNLLRMI